jgi:hypothetical protein
VIYAGWLGNLHTFFLNLSDLVLGDLVLEAEADDLFVFDIVVVLGVILEDSCV